MLAMFTKSSAQNQLRVSGQYTQTVIATGIAPASVVHDTRRPSRPVMTEGPSVEITAGTGVRRGGRNRARRPAPHRGSAPAETPRTGSLCLGYRVFTTTPAGGSWRKRSRAVSICAGVLYTGRKSANGVRVVGGKREVQPGVGRIREEAERGAAVARQPDPQVAQERGLPLATRQRPEGGLETHRIGLAQEPRGSARPLTASNASRTAHAMPMANRTGRDGCRGRARYTSPASTTSTNGVTKTTCT